jgi:anti-sigma B factor antagonist
MDLERRPASGSDVLSVRGDVDLASAPTLRRELRELLEQRGRRVVVDLSGVTYMDSSGIAVLIEGARWAQKAKGRLVLAALAEPVRMVVELAKLDLFFETAASVDAALARLGG